MQMPNQQEEHEAIKLVAPIACDNCSGMLRLVGVEPHQTLRNTDLFTYACTSCDAMQVLAVPVRAPAA